MIQLDFFSVTFYRRIFRIGRRWKYVMVRDMHRERGMMSALGALSEGRIRGAAIDVFDTEPLPADHPLRSLPNALLTGHVGYVTRDLYTIFYRDAVEDIAAYQAGSPIRLME